MSTKHQKIWAILDEGRGHRSPDDLEGHLRAIHDAGIEISIEDVAFLIQRLPSSVEYSFPLDLGYFIADFLKQSSPKTILDPFAGLGILPILISQRLSPKSFHAISKNAEAPNILKMVKGTKDISMHVEEPIRFLDKMINPDAHLSWVGQFDAVVSCPPFGLRPSAVEVWIDENKQQAKDDYGNLVILKACETLSENGIGVFVVQEKFIYQRRKNSARVMLEQIGMQVTDCIQIPAGTFQPKTMITTNLIVVRRSKGLSLFIGKYSSDKDHQKTLLNNLHTKTEGRRTSQGKLVISENFLGYSYLEASERARNLAQRMGLNEIEFNKVFKEVNITKSGAKFERLKEKPDSVYLPLMAKTPATTSQDQLPERLKSYLQLVVNSEVAEAEYIAGLLNTELGQAIRDMARRGETIPRVDQKILSRVPFYLPELTVQRKTVKQLSRINRLKIELNEIEGQIQTRPMDLDKIEEAINTINREERFQDWIDTLPFPLASILWAYHAKKEEPKEQYGLLLHFFEALAEFLAVVHLSAFTWNKDIWSEIKEDLIKNLESQNLSYERATFGTWKFTVEFLSAQARRYLNDKDQIGVCFTIYKTRNQNILDRITSKRLLGILGETNAIRNQWSGHVGVVSEVRANQIHEDLFRYLSKVREVFGTVWESYQLLYPGKCEIESGIYTYSASQIMGTRTPFQKINVELTEPMNKSDLHLWSTGGEKTLQMLPLIKIVASPKTQENACYFFNRRENEKIRFLSYYFEPESEVIQPFEDTALALELLKPDDLGSQI